MSDDTATTGFPDFAEFFRAVTTHEPYAWQRRLAERVAADGWPGQIAVPTGLGKTAAIIVAVYDLARRLHERSARGGRSAPQRIFHVVNRRTLVDSTDGFIGALAERINGGGGDATIAPIRRALSTLLGPQDDMVVVTSAIHGDSPKDTQWLRASGCVIVTLTPHQFVSRLLMRGFSVLPGRRPIDAGLVGVDRLVLFDEPHLASVAVRTILDAEALQREADSALGVPVGQTVLMGATLPVELADLMSDRSVISVDGDEQPSVDTGAAATAFQTRLHAARRLHLRPIAGGPTDTAVAKAMVAQARAALTPTSPAVVVFANTVALAQRVYMMLRDATLTKHDGDPASEVRLITSRFRAIDRNAPERRISGDAPAGITVTTQCLEVGVDVSFDALVTEAAPWNALVQRLGRLNRDGSRDDSDAYVVIAASGAVRRGTAYVYGEEPVAAATRLLVAAHDEASDGVDVSPAALSALMSRADAGALDGTPPRPATLHSGLVPLMTHTRPVPVPDLRVEAFISGPDRPPDRDVDVCWRDRPDLLDGGTFGDVHASETVGVPRRALARFLRGEPVDDASSPIADVGGAGTAPDRWSRPVRAKDCGLARVWDATTERWRPATSVDDVLSSERVVFPTVFGGYSRELGWTGREGRVDDVHLAAGIGFIADHGSDGRAHRLRLAVGRPSLEALVSDGGGIEALPDDSPLRVLWDAIGEWDAAGAEPSEAVESLLQVRVHDALEARVREVSGRARLRVTVTLGAENAFSGEDGSDGHRTAVCVVQLPAARSARDGSVEADALELVSHLEQVADWASADARCAGVGDDIAALVEKAARWHDVGKAFPAFQRMLTSRSVFSPDTTDQVPPTLVAKSPSGTSGAGRASYADDLRARRAAGLPDGFRHEAATVEQLRSAAAEPLVEHLAGAHHGWYRPVFPVVDGVQERGFEHADDFDALNRTYGPWGLAYLEALLRLADWRASAHPERRTATQALPPLLDSAAQWEDLFTAEREALSTIACAAKYRLSGLVSRPLTGWFAAVGLLAAAHDAGDTGATLFWEGTGSGAAPQLPILETTLDVRELVADVVDAARWDAADALVVAALGSGGEAVNGGGIGRKSQKLRPADRVRRVLREADLSDDGQIAHIILGIVGDAMAADASRQLELPIIAMANNSSYPSVAMTYSRGVDAVDECLASLNDVTRGIRPTACDGGMDRNRGSSPAVNGMVAEGDQRQTSTALAPLAVYAMSRIGNSGSAPLGVRRRDRGRLLELPVPTRPTTFRALRSMVILASSVHARLWPSAGDSWVYRAWGGSRSGNGKSDFEWAGSIVRRGHAAVGA